MKRILSAFVAASLVLPATAVSAQMAHRTTTTTVNDRDGHRTTTVTRDRDGRVTTTVYRFNQGDRFDRNRATRYARLNYKQYRKLNAPTRGAVWVRSGDDALLVNLTTNRVLRVVRNAF